MNIYIIRADEGMEGFFKDSDRIYGVIRTGLLREEIQTQIEEYKALDSETYNADDMKKYLKNTFATDIEFIEYEILYF